MILFTNPSARAGYDTRSIFKRSLNPEFSFSKTSCLTKAEELSLPYYLPTAGGRIIGFIPFPRVLVPCEMQSVSSRIWTRVAVSISFNDNHYTTSTSICIKIASKSIPWELFNPFLAPWELLTNTYSLTNMVGWLVGWFFTACQTLLGYLLPKLVFWFRKQLHGFKQLMIIIFEQLYLQKIIIILNTNNSHSYMAKVNSLFGFYGISTFVGYLTPNPFLWK